MNENNNQPEKVASIQPDFRDEKIKELEKKLGEKDAEYKRMEEHVKQADDLARVIQGDPKLTASVRKQYAKMYGLVPEGEEPGEQPEKKPEEEKPSIMEDKQIKSISDDVKKLSRTQREQVIKDFEDRVGISQLSDQEKTEARRSLEANMNKWGVSVKDAPIEKLGELLTDSYKFVNYDKAVQEGTTERLAETFNNASGAMPRMAGRVLPGEEDSKKLNDKQRGWAEKMNLDVEKVESIGLDDNYGEKHVHPSEKDK